MSRISSRFKQILERNGKAFIPYVMAGHPGPEKTADVVSILEDCGADFVELGVPFSDPLADGTTIQKAAQRALRQGVTLSSVLDLVGSLRRKTKIPVILMTYFNPVFQYGEEKFVSDAASAGVDGVIVPDLPPDEADTLIKISRRKDFDTIFLLTPTSTGDRIRKVAAASSGFVYYVSITGITGAKLVLDPAVTSHVARIRKVSRTPVAVGFGVSTPKEASLVAGIFDGVIVGSAIVKRIEEGDRDLPKYLRSLRKAIA